MRDIKAMLPDEIAAALAELGEPKYRAKQVFQWLARGVESFDEMTDVSKKLRETLKREFFITKLKMLRKQVSSIDGTIKYLWELPDGNAEVRVTVETGGVEQLKGTIEALRRIRDVQSVDRI